MLPSRTRVSVIHRLFLRIWGLFFALLLLLSVLGYVAMRMAADRVVPLVARQVVDLRSQSNEGLFLQAERSVERLRATLLQRLERADTAAALQRFDALFARSPDGLWRLRPGLVNPDEAPTLYLHHGANGPDTSTRLRAVVSYDLLREQGPALAPPFFSVYMDFVEDGLMAYAPGVDWGGGATAEATNADYPTMRGADPARNPQRQRFWTPVYFDQQARTWMVSVIQPLDWQGRWAGTLGHDLSVQTLLDTVAASQDTEGLQLILSAEGDLIAHPALRTHIAQADGQLRIATLHDPLLDQVHRMVTGAQAASGGAGLTDDGNQWVAWSRIRGPGWFQVYLLPQARVEGLLAWGVAALFGIGMLGLMPVLWLLRRQVRTLIDRPLRRLARAVDTLGQGQTPAPVALGTSDELGRLGDAFDGMVAELAQQRTLQASQASALQAEVEERRQTTDRLEEERARLHALLGAMNQGILFVTAQDEVIYCNSAFLNFWRIPEQARTTGRPVAEVLALRDCGPQHETAFLEHLQQMAAHQDRPSRYDFDMRDGRSVSLQSHPVCEADGRFIGRLWIHEDVTRERQTAAQLIYLAERDPLTGLYNRRRFEGELKRFFRESQRHPRPCAVLFLDLDDFKYINDTFGHRAGDAVLTRVANEINSLVRGGDTFSRLGGDEFALFLPSASLEDAQGLAERVVRAVAQTPFPTDAQVLRMTASLGIAHYPTHASTAEDLVSHADVAMYQAKHMGKNRWSAYRADRHGAQKVITRLTWNERIAHALENGLLRLHCQGVYHASDGHLAHLEALVRMVDEADPTRIIAPGEFISHAEKSGKILDIDRWVIRESIALLAASPHLPGLAINLSGRSFDDPDLPGYIAEQLQQRGVAPQRLLVELTETSAVSDLRDAERFIDALQRGGSQICLDDFGTGFASFAYLKHLKADVLKIDGMFIRDLPHERDNQVFVRSIIEVARGLGKRTVAEFVENRETLVMLQALGVDMVQGYYLDKPQPTHPALQASADAGPWKCDALHFQ